ncbi:unnamed protein product, partial [Adineta steineri]
LNINTNEHDVHESLAERDLRLMGYEERRLNWLSASIHQIKSFYRGQAVVDDHRQMPPEYLVTMLLPAIGHFANGSQVRTNTGIPTNISFFTTIIGYPSVNKSGAVSVNW